MKMKLLTALLAVAMLASVVLVIVPESAQAVTITDQLAPQWEIRNYNSGSVWNTVRTNDQQSYGDNTILEAECTKNGATYFISRPYLCFDLTSLAGQTLLDADLYVYVQAKTITDSGSYDGLNLYLMPTATYGSAGGYSGLFDYEHYLLSTNDETLTVGQWKCLDLTSVVSSLADHIGGKLVFRLALYDDFDSGKTPTGTNRISIGGTVNQAYLKYRTDQRVWDGGGADNLASNALNWDGDVAIQTNDKVAFNTASTKNCQWDITTTVYSMRMETGYSGTMSQAANMNVGTGGFTHQAGTASWSYSYVLNLAGPFTRTGGTWGNYVNMICTSDGIVVTNSVNDYPLIHELHLDQDATLTGYGVTAKYVTLETGAVLTNNVELWFPFHLGGTYSNSGRIQGSGSVVFNGQTNTYTLPALGDCHCDVQIRKDASGSGLTTYNMGNNWNLEADLLIASDHATQSVRVAPQAVAVSVTGDLTLGNRAELVQATGQSVNCRNLYINGTSSAFTMAGNIYTGSMHIGSASVTLSTAYTLYLGADFVRTSGSITGTTNLQFSDAPHTHTRGSLFYWNSVTNLGTLTLGSNLNTYALVNSGTIHLGGYILGITPTEASNTVTNSGSIDATTGYLLLEANTVNVVATLGDTDVYTKVSLSSSAGASRTVTLLANTGTGALELSSSHATYTVTLVLNGKTLHFPTMIVGTRAQLMTPSDTGTITCYNITVNPNGVMYYLEKSLTITGQVIDNGGTIIHGWQLGHTVETVIDAIGKEWVLVHAFSSTSLAVPDWTNPVSQSTLSLLTVLQMVAIALPALLLGVLFPAYGGVLGVLLSSIGLGATGYLEPWMMLANIIAVGVAFYRRG